MKKEIKNVMVLMLTEEEKKAIEMVDNILATIQNACDKTGLALDLMNEETGCIISSKEIPRTRGILTDLVSESGVFNIEHDTSALKGVFEEEFWEEEDFIEDDEEEDESGCHLNHNCSCCPHCTTCGDSPHYNEEDDMSLFLAKILGLA